MTGWYERTTWCFAELLPIYLFLSSTLLSTLQPWLVRWHETWEIPAKTPELLMEALKSEHEAYGYANY